MLSRVAERIYWIGRYMERAESTARLVGVYASLALDLPTAVRLSWRALISITGTDALFEPQKREADERSVIRFLLADDSNPSSLSYSLMMARENARTTREILPSEAWEQINDLYWYVKDHRMSGLQRGGRHQFLSEIVAACQRLIGLLTSTMSHDNAYNFARLGRNLERADMTTRILDVGAASLFPDVSLGLREEKDPLPYENIIWMNVLRSLSAYQTYRQHVQNRVTGEDVVAYLLQDRYFPRAVAHCVGELASCIEHLPRHEDALRCTARLQRRVDQANVHALVKSGLHEFIDELQRDLGVTHAQIAATWFLQGSPLTPEAATSDA